MKGYHQIQDQIDHHSSYTLTDAVDRIYQVLLGLKQHWGIEPEAGLKLIDSLRGDDLAVAAKFVEFAKNDINAQAHDIDQDQNIEAKHARIKELFKKRLTDNDKVQSATAAVANFEEELLDLVVTPAYIQNLITADELLREKISNNARREEMLRELPPQVIQRLPELLDGIKFNDENAFDNLPDDFNLITYALTPEVAAKGLQKYALLQPEQATRVVSDLTSGGQELLITLLPKIKNFILEKIAAGEVTEEITYDYLCYNFEEFWGLRHYAINLLEASTPPHIISYNLRRVYLALAELKNHWGVGAQHGFELIHVLKGEDLDLAKDFLSSIKQKTLAMIESNQNKSNIEDWHIEIKKSYQVNKSKSKYIALLPVTNKFVDFQEKFIDDFITNGYIKDLIRAKEKMIQVSELSDAEIHQTLLDLTPTAVKEIPAYYEEIKTQTFFILQSLTEFNDHHIKDQVLVRMLDLQANELTPANLSIPIITKLLSPVYIERVLELPRVFASNGIQNVGTDAMTNNTRELSRAFEMSARGESLEGQEFHLKSLPQSHLAEYATLAAAMTFSLVAGAVATLFAGRYYQFFQPTKTKREDSTPLLDHSPDPDSHAITIRNRHKRSHSQ